MNKRPLVVGSIAFDLLFGVEGTIRERISHKDGVLGPQNLMFVAGSRTERFGGTGANIAYGLGLLGARPILFGSVGKDFKEGFAGHLSGRGVELRVLVHNDDRTAAFYGMSDERNEQIGIWQPNAHKKLETISIADTLDKRTLSDVGVAIVSGTPKSALRHLEEIRAALGADVKVIFDPGQMVPSFTKQELARCLALSDIFIVNEVEIEQAEKILGRSRRALAAKLAALIETRGERGSVLYEKKRATKIAAVKPSRVADVTGAGDAYRAGFIFGLLRGAPLAAACHAGAFLGARNVASEGGQAYKISAAELSAVFG